MRARTGEVERALDGACSGHADALGTLWREYQPLLLRYLRGRGLEDPEGLTTQIWIDAARGLNRFQGDSDDFRRWLFTIAHRRVVDTRRRAARRWLSIRLSDDDDAPDVAPARDATYDSYDERASLQRALDLVSTLPDAMREAVLLRIVADLSVPDVAEIMGRTPGNVRVLVHRGLQRLEQELTGGRVPAGQLVTNAWRSSMSRAACTTTTPEALPARS